MAPAVFRASRRQARRVTSHSRAALIEAPPKNSAPPSPSPLTRAPYALNPAEARAYATVSSRAIAAESLLSTARNANQAV